MARVVQIPVLDGEAPLSGDALVECRSGIRRQDVKRRGLNPVLDGPLDGALEHRPVVGIHAEHEAAVDHHPEIVEAADGRAVVAAHVLVLALLSEVVGIQGLEADEQAAQP